MVRDYVSAIHGLLAHQVSEGLHQAPEPHRVAIKALKISLVRGEHERRRKEYTIERCRDNERGICSVRSNLLIVSGP